MKEVGFLIFILAASSLILPCACVSKEYLVTESYYETEYTTEYRTEDCVETESVVTTISGDQHLFTKVYWFEMNAMLLDVFTDSIGVKHEVAYDRICYVGYELPKHGGSKITGRLQRGIRAIKLEWVPGWERRQTYGRGDVILRAYDVSGIGHLTKFSTTWKPPTGYQFPSAPSQSYFPFGQPDNPDKFEKWIDCINSELASARSLHEGIYDQGEAFEFDATGATELAIIVAGAAMPQSSPVCDVRLIWSDEEIKEKTVAKERQVPYKVPHEVEKQRTVTETRQVPFWEAIFGE